MKKMMICALMMCTSVAANAQFGGLNKLKNKVKGAVTTATSTATTATSTATSAASTATSAANIQGVTDPAGQTASAQNVKTNHKPSAAALAADPKASVNTVEQNYSKSPAQIRGFYENALDKEIFPYQPYYTPENLPLYDAASELATLGYVRAMDIVLQNMSLPAIDAYKSSYFSTYGENWFPLAEHTLNAYLAEFFADPMSYAAYRRYIKASTLISRQQIGQFSMAVQNKADQKFKDTDGQEHILFETENNRVHRWNEALFRAQQLADEVPVEISGKAAVNILARLQKNVDNNQLVVAFSDYMELCEVRNEWNRTHVKVDENTRQYIESTLKGILDKFGGEMSFVKMCAEANAAPVEMAKGVKVSAALQAIADQKGRETFGSDFVKAIFLSGEDSWMQVPDPRRPLFTSHRYIKADYIVKKGNDYFVYHYNFQQMYTDGRNPGKVYNLGASTGKKIFEKVKYE